MIDRVFALVVIAGLAFGPLGWRIWRDRVAARALVVQAEIQNLVNQMLGGESFVTIEVLPAFFRRPGRVILSAPEDWTWLVNEVWARVFERLPGRYELVIRPIASGRPAGERPASISAAA